MANHKVTYQFNFTGNLGQALFNIAGSATTATSAVGKLMERVKNLASVGFVAEHALKVFNKFNGAISDAQKAYNMQAVAERQLEQVMRNTIGATGDEIQSVKDLASAQQRLGVIGDEVQLAGAKELATYITKTDSLKRLMPMMNDMISHQYGLNASQEQAVQIAQMVGKVLDGQTGALSRAGYRFDEAQERILKFGNEEERVALLSKIVAQYVGGVNAALAATPEGKLKQQANDVGDLKERVGGLVTTIKSALLPLQVSIAGAVDKLVAHFEANRERLTGVVTTVARVASGAFGGVIGVFKGLYSAVSKTWRWLAAIAAVVALNNIYTKVSNGLRVAAIAIAKLLRRARALENRETAKNTFATRANSIAKSANSIATNVAALSSLAFAAAVRVATKAVRGLSVAIYAIPIVGWIAAAIAAIVALFMLLWDRSRRFREVLFGVWSAAKAVFHNVGVVVRRVWENVVKPVFSLWWGLVKSVYGGIWGGIKSVFGGIAGAARWLWDTLSKGFTWLRDSIVGVFRSVLGWLKGSGSAIGGFVYEWIVEPVSRAFGKLWDFVKKIFSWISGKLSGIFAPIVAFLKKIFSTNDMQDVGSAYAEGAQAGGASFDRDKKTESAGSALALPSGSGRGAATGGALPSFGDVGDSAASIAAEGGKSARNVSITINKLVERLTVSVTNLKEGSEEIRRQVSEALLTAVNDVNLAL